MLDLSELELLVEDALRCIPWRFRRRMKSVAIVVEQRTAAARMVGLYQGRLSGDPLGFRGFTLPAKVTIFQGPHERFSCARAELEQMVTDTVWHEIAHPFGMDELRVRRAERKRES